MAKYSGVWTPDMGDGADEQKASASAPSTSHAQVMADYRRQEQARAAAWMRGREPATEWEFLGGLDFLLYMKFPGTEHDVIVFEHLLEWGRLVVWCFHCWRKDCGACRWAEAAYRKELRTKRTLRRGDDDDLPF